MKFRLKRVYESPETEDGFRVLVDRLWPRGLSREKARLDLWCKDVAPSKEVREDFHHDPAKWPHFREAYEKELAANPQPLRDLLTAAAGHDTVTLLYGAKDQEHNQAVVLLEHVLRLQNRS